jgi:ribosomal protein S27AE
VNKPAPPSGHRPVADPGPEITYAECRQCGTLIAGLDGRYSCGVCGWVNHHSEGQRPLPRPEDDSDHTAGHEDNRLG